MQGLVKQAVIHGQTEGAKNKFSATFTASNVEESTKKENGKNDFKAFTRHSPYPMGGN
jgi:hypothetical protein